MRIANPVSAALLGAFLFVASPVLAQSAGLVKLADLRGSVTVQTPEGMAESAREGAVVPVGSEVTTGLDGVAVLLFSNGTVLEMEPDTSVIIVRYDAENEVDADDPFFGETSSENSRSRTLLRIESGSVTAEVPDLYSGSVWEIESEAGTAGVRGTIITYSRELGADGQWVTVTGFSGGYGYYRLPSGELVEVMDGFEILVDDNGNYEIRPTDAPAAAAQNLPEPPNPEIEQDFITPQFGSPSN